MQLHTDPPILESGMESPPAETAPAAAMLALIGGLRVSQLVYAAVQLGLADLLRDMPRTSTDLAAATGSHAPSLQRMLRALVAIGVLTEERQGFFALTAPGATLRSDVPGSLRAWALFALGDENQRAWGELAHSVRTGETAFDHTYGMDVWQYRARHPELGRLFDAAMAGLMADIATALCTAYSFTGVKRLVDVGGGDGTLLIKLLQAYPSLEGVLFDLPAVATAAQRRIAQAGLTARCATVAGDVFASVPKGGDCYLLARVIHDWDDERAVAILRNCWRAMAGEGRLLVVERIFPTALQPSPALHAAAMTDLTMMVVTGGRERSEAEYRTLLSRAGIREMTCIPTGSGLSLIEAIAAATPG